LFGAVDAPCCGGLIQFFNGALDDIRIYDVALSPRAIQSAMTPSVPPAEPPIGHWAFEEGEGSVATDSAGNHPGQIVDATYIEGQVGSHALEFNGTSAHVNVGATGTELELTDTSYTIAWWQRWNGTGGSQRPVNMDDAGDFSGGYSFNIINGKLTWTHIGGGGTENWVVPDFTASTDWQHIAAVYDGSERMLYVDGQFVGALETTIDLVTDGDDPLLFGAVDAPCCGGLIQFFNGALDDIRIYDYALKAGEVAWLVEGVVVESMAPFLTIALAEDNQVLIAWPAAAEGLQLEVTDSLLSPIIWTMVNAPIEVVDGMNTVLLPVTEGTMFFRLAKP